LRGGLLGPQERRYATARVPVDVIDRDVEGVSILLGAPRLSGRITIKTNSSDAPRVRPDRVTLTPRDGMPPMLSMHLDDVIVSSFGDFSMNAVPAGEYQVSVNPVPPGFYVADILIGSRSVFAEGVIRIGPDPIEPVEVVLAEGGGSVEGIVGSIVSRDVLNLSRVVLVPDPPRRNNLLLYESQRPASNSGEFFFGTVPPGNYKVFAFTNLPAGDPERSEEFLARFENFGVPVTVLEGQTVHVQVDLIPADR
jgi:hypothetical protein